MSADAACLVADTTEQRQALALLEDASRAFNDPTPGLRSQGEAVFLQFRQSEQAIEHALFALEQSHDAFVHFQCLSLVLEQLPSLSLHAPSQSLPHLSTLREFLLSRILAHIHPGRHDTLWPQYTRARACQAFAAVHVRLLGLELEAGKHDWQAEKIMQEHTAFIQSRVIVSDEGQHYSTLPLASALLDELSSVPTGKDASGAKAEKTPRPRSSDHTGLSSLQRRWTRSWMQEQLLSHTLSIVLRGLSLLFDAKAPLSAYANVAEKVLRWQPILQDPWAGLLAGLSFDDIAQLLAEDERIAINDADDEDGVGEGSGISTAVRVRYVPLSLSHSFLDDSLINLLATVYSVCINQDLISNREAALCVAKLQRCLLIVAGLTAVNEVKGSIRSAQRYSSLLEACRRFATDLRDNTNVRLMTDRGNALLFLSQLYNTILGPSDAQKPADLLSHGLESILGDLRMSTVTIYSFAFDIRPDTDEEEDVASLADDAVRTILAAWTGCVQTFHDTAALSSVRLHLFDSAVKPFIDARLHHASIGTLQDGEDEEADEFGEEKVSDQEAYEQTLMTLALLARQGNLSACLSHLSTIAETLLSQLAALYQAPGPVQLNANELKQLEGRWETLHWLLLIVGHILADVSKGEIAMVPREIASSSSSDQDRVAHLIQALGLDLMQMLTTASGEKPQSPQVVQSLIWFNARWIPGYLLVQSTSTLSAFFGGDSGRQKLAILLARTEGLASKWLADADVILQVAALLRSFSLSEGVMRTLLSISEFERLVQNIVEGLGVLPAKTHEDLISCLIGCIYASSTDQSPEIFFTKITSAIEQRLSSIVHQPNFTSDAVAQRADVVDSLLSVFDMFNGLAASTQPKSARVVYEFLSRFFDTLTNLSKMYKGRAEVGTAVIRIFRTLIGALDLGFGVEEDIVQSLNEHVWRLVESLDTSSLIGDSSKSALEEDVPYESLCLLLELLDDLLLASEGDASDPSSMWLSPISHRQTGDVCLFGFSKLVPVLSGDVLSVSNVRIRLAHLISQLFLLFGHRLVGLVIQEAMAERGDKANLPCAQLFQACVQALALTLNFDETKAVLDSLEGTDAFSGATRRVIAEASRLTGSSQQQPLPGADVIFSALLLPLLDQVLRALLIEPIAPSMLEAFVQTLRRLIDTVITSNVTWSDNKAGLLDGQMHLQRHLEHFCLSTPLESSRRSTQTAAEGYGGPDSVRRRNAFQHSVAQLADICLSTLLADADRISLEVRAREVAWKGRSDVQVR